MRMSWFDTRSFTGLLSQAQKSIDKVLDISTKPEDGEATTRRKPTASQSASAKQQEKKSVDQTSSGSWLSGEDSFWGSLVTQTVTGGNKKDLEKEEEEEKEEEKGNGNEKGIKKATSTIDKTLKERKLSDKGSKRNNQKKSSKKKNAIVDDIDEQSNQNSLTENEQDCKSKSNELGNLENIENSVKDIVSLPEEVKVKEGFVIKDVESDCIVGAESVETPEDSYPLGLPNVQKTSIDGISNDTFNSLVEIEKGSGNTESGSIISEDLPTNENTEVSKEREEDERNEEVDNKNSVEREVDDISGGREVDDIKCKEIEVEREVENATSPNEVVNVDKCEESKNKENEDGGNSNDKELDSFYSQPFATSTPCIVRTKETLLHEDIDNMENKIIDYPDLLKTSETSERQSSDIADTTSAKEALGQDQLENPAREMPKIKFVKSYEGLDTDELQGTNNDSFKKENERLLHIIEIRESKLVDLSKENLNLQETNVILRSQLEQLEEIHKSEDSEFEQMKEEFTDRISTVENKLQAAAKERDLYKKQLEETQKCLSSDNERQLKEFQLLSQEKDEQIAQLLEEGGKLSKQILQCNNNIKKLRANEKEMNALNEDKSTRLEETECEIERLTGILKERDGYKKEQDDAIKKLNVYIKKQDEQNAKQKLEIEESSAKLPSLQTALDNAYKEITELHKVNAAKSNEVQAATLSVEISAKEELRMAMEKIKKESQKECDVLAMEVTDFQTQLRRSEQQAARREDNLRQEIADIQMRLQEAETRNQELTQSVSIATRPLLRQIENLQHSYSSQQTSWEKLENNLTGRLAEAQSQQATAQEKERAATERSMDLNSRVASLESQVGNYRQEKSRIEAELEMEKAKSEALEEFKSREIGKIEAMKSVHTKKLESMMVEKTLLEQQLVVERTKFESEHKKLSRLEDELKEKSQKINISGSKNEYVETEDGVFTPTPLTRSLSRNTSTSSQLSLTDTMNKGLPSGGTAVLEDLHATIRHKQGELSSMQSAISTMETNRESLTKELTTLMTTNENLTKENEHLHHLGKSFQELQTKYNALLQMYGEKQEETEELKLDLQDIKIMYKAQIQELLTGR